jgi:hypothetical protein
VILDTSLKTRQHILLQALLVGEEPIFA